MDAICHQLETDIRKRRALGKGKQGVVYDFGTHVVKVSKSKVNRDILSRMSKAGVTPYIHKIHECNGLTYVFMDKLTDPFKNSKYGNQIAKLFTQMIVGGVFHNDIHAENLMAKGGRLYLIDFDNATLIPGMTQTEFDDTMKYHTSYTDETYSKRIPITFSKAQQSAIQKVRNGLLDK